MPPLLRSRAPSAIIAVWGSAVLVLLFLAARAGIGMSSPEQIHGYRFTPSTVAITLFPVPAIAWVVVLWSHRDLTPVMRVGRAVATLILVLAAILVATVTLFVIFVRPIERL